MTTTSLIESDRVIATAESGRIPVAASEFLLRKGEVRSWSGDQSGRTIEITRGTVWLTQSGDMTDFVIRKGESFRVTRPGRIVAQSLSDTAKVRL